MLHVQNVQAFYAQVMEVMEDNMDVDQRGAAIGQLQAIIEKEG